MAALEAEHRRVEAALAALSTEQWEAVVAVRARVGTRVRQPAD